MSSRKVMVCEEGVVLPGKHSGKSYSRLNFIAGFNQDNILAPLPFTDLVIPKFLRCGLKRVSSPELKPG